MGPSVIAVIHCACLPPVRAACRCVICLDVIDDTSTRRVSGLTFLAPTAPKKTNRAMAQ